MKMEIIGGLQNSLYIKLFGNEIEMFGKGSTFEFNPFYARIDFELIFKKFLKYYFLHAPLDPICYKTCHWWSFTFEMQKNVMMFFS
jgi:hypothetical protein